MDDGNEVERVRKLAQSKGEAMDFIAAMADELTQIAQDRRAFELASLLKGVAAEAARLRSAMTGDSP